jgi:predicted nucleotidyltransferase
MNKVDSPEESTMLNKDKLLAMLHKLDTMLDYKIRLDVGGGAAAILKYRVERRTTDVDVVNSSKPIDSFKDVLERIAKEAKIPRIPGKEELWLNDNAKSVKQYLPPDYEERLTKINQKFKNIDLNFLSKPDLVIMKLSVDVIRERDVNDISALKLTLQERNLVHNLIDRVSRYEQDLARRMDSRFNQLQPELINKSSSVTKKDEIRTIEDLFAYAQHIHKFKIPDAYKEPWRTDLVSGEITLSKLVLMVDSMAVGFEKRKGRSIKKDGCNDPAF